MSTQTNTFDTAPPQETRFLDISATLYFNDSADPSKGHYIGSVYSRDLEQTLPGMDPFTGEKLVEDVVAVLNPDGDGSRQSFILCSDGKPRTFEEYKTYLSERALKVPTRKTVTLEQDFTSSEQGAFGWGAISDKTDPVKTGLAGHEHAALLMAKQGGYEGRLSATEALDVVKSLNDIIQDGINQGLDRKTIGRNVAKLFHPDKNPGINPKVAHNRLVLAQELLSKSQRVPSV